MYSVRMPRLTLGRRSSYQMVQPILRAPDRSGQLPPYPIACIHVFSRDGLPRILEQKQKHYLFCAP